jgi:anti-sigma B factor antagonist
MNLDVTTRTDGPRGVIVAKGEIDLATAGSVRTAITDLLGKGTTHLVLDLSLVSFIDSTGLGVLVGARKKVTAVDGSFALVCSNPRLLRVLAITGLDKAMEIHGSFEEAQHAFSASSQPQVQA